MKELIAALNWAREHDVMDIDVTGADPIIFVGRKGFDSLCEEWAMKPLTLPFGENGIVKIFQKDGVTFRSLRLK